MNNPLIYFAMKKLQSNPEVANSPMGQQFMQILQSGNDRAGQELANNICSSYGLNREQAIQQARNGLGI